VPDLADPGFVPGYLLSARQCVNIWSSEHCDMIHLLLYTERAYTNGDAYFKFVCVWSVYDHFCLEILNRLCTGVVRTRPARKQSRSLITVKPRASYKCGIGEDTAEHLLHRPIPQTCSISNLSNCNKLYRGNCAILGEFMYCRDTPS